jgi:hypothetical protein
MKVDLNFRIFGYAIRFSVAPVSIFDEVADLAPEQVDAPVEAEPTPAPVDTPVEPAPVAVKGRPGRKEGWRERQAAKRAAEAVEAPPTTALLAQIAADEAAKRKQRVHEARLANLALGRAVKAEKDAKRAAARDRRAAKRAAAKAAAR